MPKNGVVPDANVGLNSGRWYKSASYLLNSVYPSMIHQYDKNRYYNSVEGTTAFPFTSTRTTNATMFNSDGQLAWAPANLIPNSTMVGASVGVVPTGWTISAPVNGITSAIVGAGVEDGMSYVDMRWSGTNSGATVYPTLNFAPSGAMTARITEEYTASVFIKLIAGDFGPGTQAAFQLFEGSPGYLAGNAVGLRAQGVNSSSYTRLAVSRVLNNASTISIMSHVQFTVNNADVIDLTIRIAAPQVERTSINSPFPFNPTTTTAYYGPRLDYDPATLLPLGVLVEGASTNSSPNSGLAGGVAGTPGTAPTGWSISAVTGVTVTTSYGTLDGFPYIDVAYSGTNTTGSAAIPTIRFCPSNSIVALNGETWVSSVHVLKIGGADSITSHSHAIKGRDAGFALISGQALSISLAASASLKEARSMGTFTFTDPLVAFAEHTIQRTLGIGASIDITLRIWMPQLEKNSLASSIIPTYGVAATRGADNLSAATGSWLTQGSGTIYTAFSHPTMAVGVYPIILQIDDGTGSNRVQAFSQSNATTTTTGARIDVAGSPLVNTGVINTVPYFGANRYVFSYIFNNARMSLNGGAVVPDPALTVPLGLTTYRPGCTQSPTTSARWIKEIRFYPTASASDAQLQALTT